MIFNISYQHRNASGIYAILNLENGRCYIGSASCFSKRYRIHKSLLIKGKHHSIRLQNVVNKNGIDCLSFVLLELCAKETLIIREQFWLDKFDIYKTGYNCTPTASSPLGRKCTPEQIRRNSESHKGQRISDETKQKISLANKGRVVTAEQKKAISESKKGIARDENTKLKLSITHSERWKTSAEYRAIYIKARQEHPATSETRQKMSDAAKARKREPLSEETKKKIGDAHRGRKISAHIVEKVAAKLRGRKHPERYKPVNQYTLDGAFIRKWPSFVELEVAGFIRANVFKVCMGQRSHAGGFIWRYAASLSLAMLAF